MPVLFRRTLRLAVSALSVFILLRVAAHAGSPRQTPILLQVQDAPVPFTGPDIRTHLVYELWMTNFSSGDAAIERVQILGDGVILQDTNAAEIATRLQPAGQRQATGTLGASMQAMLFLHIILAPGAQIPHQLIHRVTAHISAAPPGMQEITADGGPVEVDRRKVVRIRPPLSGDRYLAADSCCDAVRHTRAALPVNGHVWIAQRFAVDWEQLDSSNRIYSGPREELMSYTIFGKHALAVADAVVESVTDRYDEQVPGKYPTNISLEEADGNSLVLKLGDHCYALYAHLQRGTIPVHPGEKVKAGEVLGLVGNTGNSFVPHLHFHVMDGPSPFASNGLPYEIESFHITAKGPGTAPFDDAEANGTPLATVPVTPALLVQDGLPLDQLVISFSH